MHARYRAATARKRYERCSSVRPVVFRPPVAWTATLSFSQRPRQADHHPRRLQHLCAGSGGGLYHHPAVLEAGVIGLPDPVHGEKVIAFVALRDGLTAAEQELRDLVRSRIADYKTPEHIILLPVLPKGLTGKVQRPSCGGIRLYLYGKTTGLSVAMFVASFAAKATAWAARE